MSTYKFLGLNLWTYSDQRAIGWIGGKDSHYGDKKHYLKFELGSWGDLGAEIVVGGEDKEVRLRLGLGVATLYVSLTGVVTDKYKKAKEIAKQEDCCAYQLDYSSEGRETGVMLTFKRELFIRFSLWNNTQEWTRKSIAKKFKRFPYCEGVSKTFYVMRPF